MSKTKNSTTAIVVIVVGILSLAVGYILGAIMGFGTVDNKQTKYVGTYTNDSWNGHERVSIILREDGTCELPSSFDKGSCTYEVRDGYVYFNNQATSTTAIGDTGLVYFDHKFTKLK